MNDELVYEGWVATFTPQAWINDYAVEIDAEGESSWEVSAEYLRGLVDYYAASHGGDRRETLRQIVEVSTNESDELRSDPAAPSWIADHSGPFYCEAAHETFDIDAREG